MLGDGYKQSARQAKLLSQVRVRPAIKILYVRVFATLELGRNDAIDACVDISNGIERIYPMRKQH